MINYLKDNFLDQQYRFNSADLPVTTRNFRNNDEKDKRIIREVNKNVKKWNNYLNGDLFQKMRIEPIYIKETEDEFILCVNLAVKYLRDIHYLQLAYYGRIVYTDDIINNPFNEYFLQLINIREISQRRFDQMIRYSKNYRGPFITPVEQMDYLEKMEKRRASDIVYK